MFSNVKAKKKLMQIVIACLVVCLTLTGGSYLLGDFIQEASAATKSFRVASQNDWNNAMSSAGTGDIINITLTNNLSVSSKLNQVPSGVTVNLEMNNKSIYWDTKDTSASIMSTSYPLSDQFWGLLTNRGTLNITGTGTIRIMKINYNNQLGSGRDNYGAKVSAIANLGSGANLTIGSAVTVESYAAMAHPTSGTGGCYADQFIYSCGVYNEGTVTSSGKINVGSYSANTAVQGSASYHYAMSYGIYGGTVNTQGGTISVQARSGALDASGTCNESNQVVTIGIGVYSNDAHLLGDTSISTSTVGWESQGNNNWGGGGISVNYSAGVMYTGTNYPVISSGTDITSTFEHVQGEKQVGIPGAEDLVYTVRSDDNPSNYARRAYPVVGVAQNVNTIGSQKSEKTWNADGGYFGSNTSNTSNEVEKVFGYTSMKYYTPEGYAENVKNNDQYLVDASSLATYQSGANTGEIKSAYITNGAPGTSGTQYAIVYRYYKNTVNDANLQSVSHVYDPNIQTTKAYARVGSTVSYNGLVGNVNDKVYFGGGGNSRNSYYYELVSQTTEKVNNGTYANRDINNIDQWRATGAPLTDAGTTITSTQTLVIYLNYTLKDPSSVRVAVTDKGNPISAATTSTSFTADYTGSPLVPGVDFNIGIIDKGIETGADATYDDTVVTDVYNITGNGSGSGNNATAVTYQYSTDQAQWTDGLPRDAGTYYIKVKVNADTSFASSGTYNRLGTEDVVTCTIVPSDVIVTGDSAKTGVYGSTYAQLVPFSDYSAVGADGRTVTGTWSYKGIDSATYPNAGTQTVTLVWTPTGSSEGNYRTTEYSVTLTVNKRDVTVEAGNATVTYGEDKVNFTVTYQNIAPIDSSKADGWTQNLTFLIQYNGEWTAYNSSIPVGEYPIQVASLGALADDNNNFLLNSTGTGTLTVTKKALHYTASAADRDYIPGDSTVGVTLTYVSGANAGDSYEATIAATGTMTDANAGSGKKVTVDTSAIVLQNPDDYQLVIDNASSLTVNIAKLNLTVAADDKEITYGAAAPSFTYTISGFADGESTDNVTISGAPVFSTEYTADKTVGTYDILVDVQGMSATNYNFSGASGILTVNKATPVVAGDLNATVETGDAYSTAVFGAYTVTNSNNNASVPGTMAIKNGDTIAVYGNDETVTAVFTPADTVNYNTVEAQIEITVIQKAITGIPVIQGSPMVDQTLTLNLSGMAPSSEDAYTYQWYRGNTPISGATGTTYKVVKDDVDNTIYVVLTAKEDMGYKGTAQSAPTSEVIEEMKQVTVSELNITVPSDLTYDGKAHAATVTAKGEYANYIGAITVKYNGSTSVPVNAGTYNVTVDIAIPAEPDGGYTEDYFGPVSGLSVGTFTINKAPFNVVISAQDKVYDGTTVATAQVSTSGVIGDDDVKLAEGYSFSFADVNVGTDKAVTAAGLALAGADANNYEIKANDASADITVRTLSAYVSGVTRPYNGSTTVDIEFTNITGYAPVDSFVTVYITAGTATALSPDAGIQQISGITYKLEGSAAGNYVLVIVNEASATTEITKADYTGPVTFPTEGTLQFGYDLTFVTFGTPGQGDGTFAYENASGTVPQNLGVYTNYKVVFTPTDSKNYNTISQVVTLTVVKCELNYVVGVLGTPQSGETLSVVITGMPDKANDYINYQWYRVSGDKSEKIDGATSAAYKATEDDVGYKLVVVTYFDANDPYVFADTANTVFFETGIEGIVGETEGEIDEEYLSFWQRLMRWIQKLIEAITGLTLVLG